MKNAAPSRGRRGSIGTSAIAISTSEISPARSNPQAPTLDPIAIFRLRCESRALLWLHAQIGLHEAVDVLQAAAVRDGLVASLGQDRIQALMSDAFAAVRQPPPITLSSADYRTTQATFASFWCVARSSDTNEIRRWLMDHPADVAQVFEAWRRRQR